MIVWLKGVGKGVMKWFPHLGKCVLQVRRNTLIIGFETDETGSEPLLKLLRTIVLAEG